MDEKKEVKQVKSYSLRPSQIAWLRQRAQQESTPNETVSASTILERIIDEAIRSSTLSPSQTTSKKNAPSGELALAPESSIAIRRVHVP